MFLSRCLGDNKIKANRLSNLKIVNNFWFLELLVVGTVEFLRTIKKMNTIIDEVF